MAPLFTCPVEPRLGRSRSIPATAQTGLTTSATPSVPGRAIDELRAATARHHQVIDALMRMDQDFSVAHYGRALQAFESFLTQWEPLVSGALPVSLQHWAEGLRRLPLARRDMAVLALPLRRDIAIDLALPDEAAALGSMYVLEGSTLGGVVIARRLRRQHGIEAHNGGAYFAGWGAATASNWRRFGQVLETRIGTDAAARQRAALAAAETFSALTHILRRALDAAVHC